MSHSLRFVLAAVIALCSASVGHAIPQLINYQGLLTDGGGTPITVATNVEFRIWDMGAGGTELWMETQSVTPDADGLFNVLLGSVNPIPDSALAAAAAHLGMTVSPDAEMSPRTQLVAVAYAFRPGTVDGASGGNITSKLSIGPGHTNTGDHAFAAGENNESSGDWSAVGGGSINKASGENATVGGGRGNNAIGDEATVSGGKSNGAIGIQSTVGGGKDNVAIGDNSTIAGGFANGANGPYSTTSGGRFNFAGQHAATVGGGESNAASGFISTVSGGLNNTASNDVSTVGGGANNTANASGATVGGGSENTASSSRATVSGGTRNTASGLYATVPGGRDNTASGQHSFACGANAKAKHGGAIVIAANGSSDPNDSISSNGAAQMVLRADGHFYLTDAGGSADIPFGRFLNTSTGGYLTTGGTWTNASDANQKENYISVDAACLLAKIAALSITEWNYKRDDDAVRHIGPTAQEFYALFGVGNDDKSISTIDPAGIALAAIQELDKRTRHIGELTEQNRRLESELAELREMVEALMANK